MKTIIRIFVAAFFFTAITLLTPQKAKAQVSVSFQLFYDDLSPYGNWVDYPQYGYVWMPNVSHGFRPYGTNGHWVFTEDGWTWVSNYSWGWAPFHYGRWLHDPYYGWVWVPDNEWGPGWVSWRRSDDYYGWAPIAPGISIDIAYSSGYNLPYNDWVFVRNNDFGRPNIYNYYVDNSRNVTIINNTTVINNTRQDRTRNTRYNAGPDRREVERVSSRSYSPVAITETNKPGERLSNNQLQVYRPRVEKPLVIDRKPVPKKVMNRKDVKPSAEKNTATQPVKNNQPVSSSADQEKPAAAVKQTPVQQEQQKRNNQPVKQQPVQQQQKSNDQPVKQQPAQQQQKRNDQPPVQQQQPKRNDQPVQQQPMRQPPVQQQKRNDQPAQQQPARQQPPAQQKQNAPPQRQSPENKKGKN
ncbi:MAG: DUF6600 domain-containing protein [Chitinophagaceae bacterium]